MMKNRLKIFSIKICLLCTGSAGFFSFGESLNLKKTIQRALKNSLSAQLIESQKQSDELILAQALAPFDWTVSAGAENLNDTIKLEINDLRIKQHFAIQKKWALGTTFKVKYEKGSNLFRSMPFCLSPLLPDEPWHCDQFFIQIEQSLLQNFFGRSDRLQLKAARLRREGLYFSRTEELKKTALKAGEKFWNSYLALIQLKIAESQVKNFKELLQAVKNKKDLGYAQPGEEPLVLAQYEKSLSLRRTAKIQIKNANSDLKTFLQMGLKEKIYFPPHRPPALPQNREIKNIESFNAVKTAEKKMLSDLANIQSKKYFYLPKLSLQAGAGYFGQGASPSESFAKLKNKDKLNFTVSLNLIYPIPSSLSRWRQIKTFEQKKLESRLQFQQVKNSFKNQTEAVRRLVEDSHSAMLASYKILKFQQKALEEIKTAYIQGRVKINDLISAQEKSSIMELEKSKAQKTFSLALLRFYSLTDRLLEFYSPQK